MTFLFTDIEGSTPLWEERPGVMAAALERHDIVLGEVIAGHGGHVFSRAGDAFAAAFEDPAEAASAALEGQRRLAAEAWPDPVVIRVRMGLHTGTAQRRGGDYFGPTLNRAARIASAAHGGQILLSSATAELVRRHLPADSFLVDLGDLHLKGLTEREHVCQLGTGDLESAFPPLRAGLGAVGGLPRPASSFVGRADELKALAELLPTERLVTLVGVGGVGKTRLALELASAAAAEFPGGIYFCGLAAVGTTEAAFTVVADAVGARPHPGADPADPIVEAVAGRRVLIVLDNCEHVLDAAAEMAARLAAGQGTTVLATSRQLLAVGAERVWLVPAMDTADAMELFDRRARAANPRFDAGPDEQVITTLCRRLECLPLAIELAAARTRSLTPGEITARLDDSLRLLRHVGRDAEPRQRSVRATIEWSFKLLSPAEQLLFVRLAVFAGSFDLDAVEQVCTGDDGDVVELLASLVDKSLVVADPHGDSTRYRLLEPLRQYGGERLAERDDADDLATRHADHYVEVADRARRWYEGTENRRGAAAFAADWDNLRAALHQSVGAGEVARVSRLLDAAYHYAAFDYRYEYGEWAEAAVAMPEVPPLAYAECAYWRMSSDPDGAVELARRGLQASGDESGPEAGLCWFVLGAVHYYTGQAEVACAEVGRYFEIVQGGDSSFRAAHGAGMLATICSESDPLAAESHARRAAQLAARLDNQALDAWLAHVSGLAASASGQHGRAGGLYRRAVELGDGGVNPMAYTQALMALALRAPPAERAAAYRVAVQRLRAARQATDMWIVLESLAAHWATAGHLEAAAILLGHLEAHEYGLASTERRRRRALAAISADPDSTDWLTQGAELDGDQVVAYALRCLDELP